MAVDEFGNPIADEGAEATTDENAGNEQAQETTETFTEEGTQPVATALGGVEQGEYGEKYGDAAQARAETATPDYAGYEKSAEAPTGRAGEEFMTPETTVAGQLEKILQSDSPLLKLQETQAKQRANALGMLSSSDYIGASQRALIQEGLKVAAPDAQTAKEFKQQEQALANEQTKIATEAQVSGDLTVQKARIAEQQKKIDDAFALTLKGLDADQQADIENLRGEWQTKFKELDAQLSRELTQQEIDANVEQKIMSQAHDMINQYQISVQQLLGNQAFLESMPDKASMHAVFNDMLAGVTSSIEFASKAAGVYDGEMQDYISDLIADSSW